MQYFLLIGNYYFCKYSSGSHDVILHRFMWLLKSWPAADHINEDLQLERSGRVGPVVDRELTDGDLILWRKWWAGLGLAVCVSV